MVESIRKLCKREGITLSALERRAGLPENSIYKWDVNRPSVDKVLAVAKILKSSVETIAKGG